MLKQRNQEREKGKRKNGGKGQQRNGKREKVKE